MKNQGKHCAVCGKASMQRNLVSHAKNMEVRHALPNLHRARIVVGGKPQSVWVCTRCLKGGRVVRATARKLVYQKPK